jgi:hypothetical protein
MIRHMFPQHSTPASFVSFQAVLPKKDPGDPGLDDNALGSHCPGGGIWLGSATQWSKAEAAVGYCQRASVECEGKTQACFMQTEVQKHQNSKGGEQRQAMRETAFQLLFLIRGGS